MSDEALRGIWNARNVQEFRSLMREMEKIIREKYGGRWENMDEVFRQSPREDKPKGHDTGRYGKGSDFIFLVWFQDRELASWEEWRHYEAHLLRLPTGYRAGQDWANPYTDETGLDVVNGVHPTI